MNNDMSETRWRLVREQTRKWWGKLTDDDLEQIEGKAERLADSASGEIWLHHAERRVTEQPLDA